MINVLGLNDEDKQVIYDSYAQLCEKYKCTLENDKVELYTNTLQNIPLVEVFNTVSIKNVFEITTDHGVFSIISIYLANFRDHLAPRVHIYGYLKLKKDFSRVAIRPKTGLRFIGSLFNKGNQIFNTHRKLNDKYVSSAKDPEFARKNLHEKFLDEVAAMNKLHIDFDEHNMLVTFNNRIRVDDTLELAAFMDRVIGFFK